MTVLLLRTTSALLVFLLVSSLGARAADRVETAAAVPVVAAPALSYADMEGYRLALAYADAGNLDGARAIANGYNDPLFSDLVVWTDLAQRDTLAGFDEIAGFIRRNPDWPLMRKLLRQAERRMPETISAREAADWFAAYPPVSDLGKIRFAEAQIAIGQRADGEAALRQAWIEGDFPADEEARIRARHGALFSTEDNIRRLDELLWRHLPGDARRQAGLLGSGYVALADARLRLSGRQEGVDDAVRGVPASLQNDPGLLYERAAWRRSRGLHDGVVELLDMPQSTAVKAAAWWPVRRWALRESLDLQDPATAYRLASRHGMTEADGYSFSDAEWLAGWIALRFLGQPREAWRHFDIFYKSVSTPVSLGRGAYWIGRAAEASGDSAAAGSWYAIAAGHGTSYYGQLAAAQLPEVQAALPTMAPVPGEAARAAFDRRDSVRAARLLGRLGEYGRLTAFMGHLSVTAENATDAQLVGNLAVEVGRPSYAVHTARRVRRDGVIAMDQLFPLPPLDTGAYLEKSLVLSIIRQESSFDERAVSRSGARGLMQLMPGTASDVAGDLGADHTQGRLTNDPDYNLRLGQTYLAGLIDRFSGSWVLAIAAYNAGPGNVNRWLNAYGDPRSPRVDIIDWIERIPFEETRNYVQRVLESVYVYRLRVDPARREPAIAGELLAFAVR